MQYLKERQYYADRYDLGTIEQCLNQLKMLHDVGQRMRSETTLKKYPDSEFERNLGLFRGRMLFFIQAQRHKNRASTIAEWIESDRIKQDKQDNTPAPRANCPECGSAMTEDGSHHLVDWDDDKPMRVLFTFNCPKCKKRQGVYDDGEIYVSKSDFCPDCKQNVEVKSSKKDEVITTHYKCKNCGYSKKDIWDLKKGDEEHKKWQEEYAQKELEDKQLLEKYRAEFCLSDEEGQKYVETLEALEVGHEVKEEVLAEMDTPAHEKLLSVNKISITDLEVLVNKVLKESGFTRLSFGNPDMDRHVLVPFTLQETKPKRRDQESISDLYNLLKTALKDTNWRAPKDLISYRLGFLSGKLKGYESEDDLLKLFGKEEPKKPKSKLDPEFRAKYEHHSFVQLARMDAEYEATKRIRTRRLKDEPDGFFLNDGGRGYTCGICRRTHNGEDIWWRPDGLRCRDCWRNIQEDVIPVLDLDKEWWEEEHFDKYDVEKRGIKPSSIKKLRREGVLVGRDLKDTTGNTYWTVFLVSENESFLDGHPKKKVTG
jgi:DNA-directed RNA polymerase subunit M/transcription elongation factor TFIIS